MSNKKLKRAAIEVLEKAAAADGLIGYFVPKPPRDIQEFKKFLEKWASKQGKRLRLKDGTLADAIGFYCFVKRLPPPKTAEPTTRLTVDENGDEVEDSADARHEREVLSRPVHYEWYKDSKK